MKKTTALFIAALFIAAALLSSLCACNFAKPAATGTVTETEPATETPAETAAETDAETDTAAVTEDPEEAELKRIYGIYKNAMEKTSTVDNLSFTLHSEIRTSTPSDDGAAKEMIMKTDMSADVMGANSMQKKVLLHYAVSTEENGQTPVNNEGDGYIEGSKYYVKTAPFDGYIKADGKAPLSGDLISSGTVDIEEFKDAVIENKSDGTVSVSINAYDGLEEDALENIKSALGLTEFDVTDPAYKTVYTVSADEYITGITSEMTCGLSYTTDGVKTVISAKITDSIVISGIGQDIKVERPTKIMKEKYSVYDPELIDTKHAGTIVVYENGTYDLYTVSNSEFAGLKVDATEVNRGDYTLDGDKLTCLAKDAEYKINFETEEQRAAVKAMVDTSKQLGQIDEKTYGLACRIISEEGYSGSVTELAESDIFGTVPDFESVYTADGGTVYKHISGMQLKDNEYYVTPGEYLVTFGEDGKCTVYNETVGEDENDLGEYTAYTTFYGTYEKDGATAVCVLNESNLRIKYKSADSVKQIKASYKEMLDNNLIGAAVYDYYMALISEDGYTETKTEPDTVTLKLEAHTHTAYIEVKPAEA